MFVLDENIPASQRQLLRNWRIHFRVVGVDTAPSGTSDENLIPVLHHLPQPTFFSLDGRFFRSALCHARYGLVHLDVSDEEAAEFIRRFLRHPAFETQTKRLGVVARVRARGVQFWRKGRAERLTAEWKT